MNRTGVCTIHKAKTRSIRWLMAATMLLLALPGCDMPPVSATGVSVGGTTGGDGTQITTSGTARRGELVRVEVDSMDNLREVKLGGVLIYDHRLGPEEPVRPILLEESAFQFRIPQKLSNRAHDLEINERATGISITVEWRRLGQPWVHAAVGETDACGLKANGTLWCWGRSLPPGDGVALPFEGPVPVAPERIWNDVTVGPYHTCALDNTGAHHCWGRNDDGRIDPEAPDTLLEPHLIQTRWEELYAGPKSSCGITATGTIDCFGGPSPRPVYAEFSTGWTSFTASGSHACAINEAGQAWCSGLNHLGQLGDGTTDSAETFVAVADEGPWAMLAAGSERMLYTRGFTCGLKTDGSLWCWGIDLSTAKQATPLHDREPRLIMAEPVDVGVDPADVPDGPWSMISAGHRRLCGINEGRLFCWTGSRPGMERMDSVSNWAGVNVGTYQVCVWSEDGLMSCMETPPDRDPDADPQWAHLEVR